ncbi:MAG: hypothetical protein ACR2P7_09655, partial [bacterium]
MNLALNAVLDSGLDAILNLVSVAALTAVLCAVWPRRRSQFWINIYERFVRADCTRFAVAIAAMPELPEVET